MTRARYAPSPPIAIPRLQLNGDAIEFDGRVVANLVPGWAAWGSEAQQAP
jgi:hypothetical protein